MSLVLKAAVALAAIALLVLAWRSLPMLRGTPFSDVRHLVFVAGAFLLLTGAEWVAGRIGAVLDGDKG